MRNWKFNHIDFSTFPFYEGNDLGVHLHKGQLSVKIWAPTAIELEFHLYAKSSGGKAIRVENLLSISNGCWELQLQGDFKGLYYTFRVNDGEWLNETPGIDVRAVGANGRRGLIFDSSETNPSGWEHDEPVQLANPVDAILYEVHVRDFSIVDHVGFSNKGKFLAFTEENVFTQKGLSAGIQHLKELGITHVHLLPVFDFFTVDENHPDEKYNWGYDPLNYNVPEGSYSSNQMELSVFWSSKNWCRACMKMELE